MTKYDYLAQLKHHLQPLPLKDKTVMIKYYDKYFTDAGPENEQQIMAALGTPKELADKLISKNRHTLSGMMNETKKNINETQHKNSLLFTITVTPIIFIVFFLIIMVLILITLCLSSILILAVAAGLSIIIMGFPYISNTASLGLFLIGTGLILISVPVLLFIPTKKLISFVIRKTITGTFDVINKLIKGKGKIKK